MIYTTKPKVSQIKRVLLLSSWCNLVKDTYASTNRKWDQFWITIHINTFLISINCRRYSHFSYGFIWTWAWLCLNMFSSKCTEKHYFPSKLPIKRFIKGDFIIKQPAPCFTFTWYIKKILNNLDQLPVNKELLMKLLSKKTVVLLHSFFIRTDNILPSFNVLIFFVKKSLKCSYSCSYSFIF